MTDSAMDIAISYCALPTCRKCGVKAESERIRETNYKNAIRLICPSCGKASGWHFYDSYCAAIPVLWRVIRDMFVDFGRKE